MSMVRDSEYLLVLPTGTNSDGCGLPVYHHAGRFKFSYDGTMAPGTRQDNCIVLCSAMWIRFQVNYFIITHGVDEDVDAGTT